jgi:hypothetical protein
LGERGKINRGVIRKMSDKIIFDPPWMRQRAADCDGYDWGIPSEHRRDLQKGPVHFEQADLARLNLVGEATDFDVTGKTGTKTTR